MSTTGLRGRLDDRSRDFLLALVIQGSGAVLAYASQVVMARLLGPAAFGQVSVVTSLSLVVGLVGTVGLGALALRVIPVHLGVDDGVVSRYTAFAYRTAAGVALALVALALGLAALGVGSPGVVVVVGVLCGLTALVNLGNDVGRALGRFATTYGASVIGRPLITMAVMGGAWAAGARVSLLGGVVALTAAAAVTVVAQRVAIMRHAAVRAAGTASAVRDERRSWLRTAPTFLVASIATLVLLQTDVFVGSLLLDPDDLGHYAAAVRTVSALSVVTGAIGTVAAPRLARSSTDVRAFAREARATSRWQFVLIVVAGAGLALAAPVVLSLFGPGFESARFSVVVLVLGHVVNAGFGPGGTLLVYSGRPHIATVGTLLAIVCSASLCAVGAARYGLDGAAVGSALGMACSGAIMWLLARRYTTVGASIFSGLRVVR